MRGALVTVRTLAQAKFGVVEIRSALLVEPRRILMVDREPPRPSSGEVLIRVRRVGICGSDVHYYAEGRAGGFVMKHPFVLGHEFAGEVADVGAGVRSLEIGDRVAVEPIRPCGACGYCRTGRYNLCPRSTFYGSASTDPHTDGALQEFVLAREDQCYLLPKILGWREGAMAEPLSVAIHAVRRAGMLLGKNVFIFGSGTIGLLVLQLSLMEGAENVFVGDIIDFRLAMAERLGASRAINVGVDHGIPAEVDVVFEASGSPEALAHSLDIIGRGGIIVQIGNLPAENIKLPFYMLVSKELEIRGVFRSLHAFGEALSLMARRKVQVKPLVTHVYPFARVNDAFAIASGGKGKAIKVQVAIP